MKIKYKEWIKGNIFNSRAWKKLPNGTKVSLCVNRNVSGEPSVDLCSHLKESLKEETLRLFKIQFREML